MRNSVSKSGAAAAPARESSTTKLARFFPNATPVRIPVRLTRVAGGSGVFTESTIIEFGTPTEVLFASTMPLEFADKLRLRTDIQDIVSDPLDQGRLPAGGERAQGIPSVAGDQAEL